MKSVKKISGVVLRIGISIALLVFLFSKVDRRSLFESIRNADKGLLILAFLVLFLNYILCLFRWEMLLKALKVHLPLKRVIISFAGGHFFNLFLPSTIGGDLMRSIDLAVHTRRPKEVIATVFLDRLSGFIGLALFALMSLIFGWKLIHDSGVFLCVVIIIAVLIVVLVLLFNRPTFVIINKLLHSPNAGKVRELLKNLHEEIHYFQQHKPVIFNNLILSVIIQATTPICFYIIALSLGLKLNVIYFLVFIPIISAITLLPISLGGLGLRDATTIFFFAKIGVERNLAFAMSLINFSFILIYGTIGGLIYVLTVRHRRVQHHKAPHIPRAHR